MQLGSLLLGGREGEVVPVLVLAHSLLVGRWVLVSTRWEAGCRSFGVRLHCLGTLVVVVEVVAVAVEQPVYRR